MGFRDIQTFNRAMLTKTAWRMQNEPDSMWVRIMKGIYYPNTTFMNARKGQLPSWAWASILEGRQVLAQEGVWQIGNGESVHVTGDKWIPSIAEYRLQEQGSLGIEPTMRVEDLIDGSGTKWQLDEIRQWLTEEEVQGIETIQLNRRRPRDRLVWPTTKKGDAQPNMVHMQIMHQQHAAQQ